MIHTASFLEEKFSEALDYSAFVARGRPQGHHVQWEERYGQLALDESQRRVVERFTREMNVLCLTGTWCGDCALQGSAMQRVADANPQKIHVRFLMRDDSNAEMIVANQINGGFRVPFTFFCAEDFEPVSRFGDRTLSRYRSMARKQLPEGAVTIVQPQPADPVRAVLNEVLDEFERVHLLLRTSTRLRAKYGD